MQQPLVSGFPLPTAMEVLAGVVGAAYVVVYSQWSRLNPIPTIPFLQFLLLSCVSTTVLGFALGRRSSATPIIALSAFLGICVGVVANAEYDFKVHAFDHNLLPFEIVIDTVFAMPGIVGGAALAKFVARKADKHKLERLPHSGGL